MQIWQDGLVALLASVGLASIMWTLVRAVLFAGPEVRRELAVLLPVQGDGEQLEEQVRALPALRRERGLAGRALLVEYRWVSVCARAEVGKYLPDGA